jgi:hypothetical protein
MGGQGKEGGWRAGLASRPRDMQPCRAGQRSRHDPLHYGRVRTGRAVAPRYRCAGVAGDRRAAILYYNHLGWPVPCRPADQSPGRPLMRRTHAFLPPCWLSPRRQRLPRPARSAAVAGRAATTAGDGAARRCDGAGGDDRQARRRHGRGTPDKRQALHDQGDAGARRSLHPGRPPGRREFRAGVDRRPAVSVPMWTIGTF